MNIVLIGEVQVYSCSLISSQSSSTSLAVVGPCSGYQVNTRSGLDMRI